MQQTNFMRNFDQTQAWLRKPKPCMRKVQRLFAILIFGQSSLQDDNILYDNVSYEFRGRR